MKGGIKEISHVIITSCNINSWEDTLAKRLEGAKITIDGQLCGNMSAKVKDLSPRLEEKIVCPVGVVGSKVRIQSAKTDEYLHLAEIEVYYFKNSKYDNVDTKFCPKMFNSDGSYNKQECKACMTGTQCSETNS